MLHFEALYADALPATVTNSCRKISGEADLIEELAAYSPLIPDGKDLKVTFMLEFPDEAERKVHLNQLIGIKELISI